MNQRIEINPGIIAGMKVAEMLKQSPRLKDKFVAVSTMQNGREQGLSFWVSSFAWEQVEDEPGFRRERNTQKTFTWCVYEHRNSDALILNGKEGICNSAGDLPYMTDSKWDYIAAVEPGEYRKLANRLIKEILAFYKKYPES